MMATKRFFDYVRRYKAGTLNEDVTYRAYDLLDRSSTGRLLLALDRINMLNGSSQGALGECRAALAARYLSLSDAELQQCLLEWYVWDRIVMGECRHWKHR